MKKTKEDKLKDLESKINKICEDMKSLFQDLIFRSVSHRELYMENIKEKLERSYEKIKKKD